MKIHRWVVYLAASLPLLAVYACAGPAPTTVPASPTPGSSGSGDVIGAVTAGVETAAAPPALAITPSPLPPTPQVSETLAPTLFPTNTATEDISPPAITESVSLAAGSCQGDICIYSGAFFLQRPIKPPDNDVVDATYRFGSTQGGKREAHHGVEMLNGFGTPVYAAGDGLVVVAGEDRDPISAQGEWPIVYYGPFSYFYGNLVLIEHRTPQALLGAVKGYPDRVYSLYAHLSEIMVEQGEQVRAGQQIGRVGITGVSMGSHLHFEVRVGENTYQNSRNPELWLEPHAGEGGDLNGGLSVRVLDPYGEVQAVSSVVVEYQPHGVDQPAEFELYLQSYEDKALLDQPPWHESFAAGDLPAGLYRVSFPYFGRQELLVDVFPNQLTLLTFQAK